VNTRPSGPLARLAAIAVVWCLLVPSITHAATITILNSDGPGEGFNDATAATPEGGNPGTTRGQQRLNVFEYAADFWGDRLESMTGGGADIEIVVDAAFDTLFCSGGGAVLGSAGPFNIARDFAGAIPATWYPFALADAVAGSDLDPGNPDILATFNSVLDDPICLGTRRFYYGFDGNSGINIDLASVVIHELGHGLGFLTTVNLATGARIQGFNDVYMRHLEDHSALDNWHEMNDNGRATSALDDGDLHWTGPAVVAHALEQVGLGNITDGVHPSGHVEMYAPNPLEPGSSVAHWNTDLTPNDIMEPFLVSPLHNLELTLKLMEDIGWEGIIECGDANRDGARLATDALIALRTSVNLAVCRESLCDANGDGRVVATDALIMLKGATGQPVEYSCGLS
jgi:hypothetical protein